MSPNDVVSGPNAEVSNPNAVVSGPNTEASGPNAEVYEVFPAPHPRSQVLDSPMWVQDYYCKCGQVKICAE